MALRSKVIVVTGASRGIGLWTVRKILSEPEQHRVVAIARSPRTLGEIAERFPLRFAFMTGDLSDDAMGQRVIDFALSCYNQLDGVVVNHAIIEPVQRLADADVAEWRRAYDINFFGAVAIVQAAILPLRSSRGTIVLVSSGASITPYPSLGAYSSSKAAFNNLAALIRTEEKEIMAVAVDPGRVDTNLHTLLREKYSRTMPPEDSATFFRLKECGELLSPELSGGFIGRLVLDTPTSLNGRFISYNNIEKQSTVSPQQSVI